MGARAISLATLSGFVAACGVDTTTPPRLASAYDLVLYEWRTLPAVTRRIVASPTAPGGASYSCDDTLTGMRLEIEKTERRYTQTESRLLVCDDGRPDSASTSAATGSYTLMAETIELDSDPLGSAPGSVVQKSYANYGGDALVIYQRALYRDGVLVSINAAPVSFIARR